MATIYGLIDAAGDLRYVGKANDPNARLRGHMREAGRRKFPIYDWIAKHGRPVMIVLEDGCADWRVAEREWIAAARASGCRLLNVADGGDQPHCTRAQRQANSAHLKVYKFTPEDARRHAARLNDGFAKDPKRKRLKDLKANLGRHVVKFGLRPEQWAKLAFLGISNPRKFGALANRLIDRHMPPFTDDEERRYLAAADRLCG